MSYDLCYNMQLAVNGQCCSYTAKGDYAVRQIEKIAQVCSLTKAEAPPENAFVVNLIEIPRSEVEYYSAAEPGETVFFEPAIIMHVNPTKRNSTVYIVDAPKITESGLGFIWRRLFYLPIISLVMHGNAGLVHGILAVSADNCGVIISGPSGIGKSTAARRLPPPWQVWADDCLVVLKDDHGDFYAQPVPTWSIFFSKSAPERTFNCQSYVKLTDLFLLDRGEDRVKKLDYRQTMVGFTRSVGDMTRVMLGMLPEEIAKPVFQRSFKIAADFVTQIPAYQLYATLDGKFWQAMEQVVPNE